MVSLLDQSDDWLTRPGHGESGSKSRPLNLQSELSSQTLEYSSVYGLFKKKDANDFFLLKFIQTIYVRKILQYFYHCYATV